MKLRNEPWHPFQGAFFMKYFFKLCIAATILINCKGKEKQPLTVFVSPSSLNFIAKPGERLEFRVSANSEVPIRFLKVVAKEKLLPPYSILDSSISVPTKRIDSFIYVNTPDIADTSNLLLTFTVIDQDGNSLSITRQVLIYPDFKVLTEYSGFQMFLPQSGNIRNAFNLIDLNYATLGVSDSSNIDFHDTTRSQVLSRSWVSPRKGKFVRFNDFNYGQANSKSVKDAFDAGLKFDILSGISTNDIILYAANHDSGTLYACIKIVSVENSPGEINPSYRFNVKK